MRKLGKGFADAITKGGDKKIWSIKAGRAGKSFAQARVAPFFVLFVFGIGILIARLFWVTVVRGNYYRKISEENRVREEVVWSPRGIIYDRNGKALVLNRPVYRAYKANRTDRTHTYLTQEEILRRESEGRAGDIELFVSRDYPFGEAFAHIIGYVGEAGSKDLENGLRLGSLAGKSGLEESFDKELRGEEGKVLAETNAYGKKIKELGKIAPKPGKDLNTTLDAKLQVKAAEAMGGKTGAVIASKPNGEILVLYSSPSFDPNLFVFSGGREPSGAAFFSPSGSSESSSAKALNNLLNNPSRPLFNRAIGGLYPPGSTFKIITAVAALEESAIDKNTLFLDKGFIKAGSSIFRNWYYTQYGKTEGEVDIIKAIARSVDTYFYKAGEKVGIDNIAKWGRNFGLGRESGIGIIGEAKGRMPDKKWKLKAKGERWYLGDTYHAAIGQGDILVTPLQVNLFTGVIANGGKLCKPRIIKSKVKSQKSKVQVKTQKSEKNKCRSLGLHKDTLNLVAEGMRDACSPGGTGFPLFNFSVDDKEISVACKTGTAEYGDPEKTHAWFTAFAPVGEPKIVITVLLEGGGSGAYDAAPIAKEILGEYFKLN